MRLAQFRDAYSVVLDLVHRTAAVVLTTMIRIDLSTWR